MSVSSGFPFPPFPASALRVCVMVASTVSLLYWILLLPVAEPEPASVPTVYPLPSDTVFRRVEVNADGTISDAEPVTAGANQKLIYSNTRGSFAVAPGAGFHLADDLALTARFGGTPPCRIRRIEFPVVGKVNPAGVGGPFAVDFALYRSCPSLAATPAVLSSQEFLFAGTSARVEFATDDAAMVVWNFGTNGILIPTGVTSVWLGVTFNRANAGIVVGAPAEQGFSCDLYDYPGFQCNTNFGGFPDHPYGAINVQMFANDDCGDGFVGYRANRPSAPTYNPGADVTITDDIELGVDDCQMIAYEVAARGLAAYTMEIRPTCDSPPIAGTTRIAAIQPGVSEVRLLRQVFDPPITLPKHFVFAVKVSQPTGGVVIAGQQPCVGETRLTFQVQSEDDTCADYYVPGGIHGAINLTIFCAGTPPVGACCDIPFPDANGETPCRELPRMNCGWPPPRTTLQPAWFVGSSCDPSPFARDCGIAACCRPDQVCQNLTKNACDSVEPLDRPRDWQAGKYCGEGDQVCSIVPCIGAEGDCLDVRDTPACENAKCCVEVCSSDPYCCIVEWDRACVALASELCSGARAFDECHHASPSLRAKAVSADSLTVFSNAGSTASDTDTEFCCSPDTPSFRGYGSTWFSFVATDTSARVSLCDSDPDRDSLVNVLAAGDPTTPQSACETLSVIACSDDVDGCGGGKQGRICVPNLIPGRTYYVMVASKTPGAQGLHQLDIRSPCFEEPIWIQEDCDFDQIPDGCELARGIASDCNRNHVPDHCDRFQGTSEDCDEDGRLDECRTEFQTLFPTTPSHSFGKAIAVDGDLLVVGDPYDDHTTFEGAAYVFRREGVRWRLEDRLYPATSGFDYLGESVAIAGGRAYIQATDYSGPEYQMRSAFLVFARIGLRWVHEATLRIDDPEAPMRVFCGAVESGGRIAVSTCWIGGSFGEPIPAIVYVQRLLGPDWVREARIQSPTGEPSTFGRTLALDGDRLAIGESYKWIDDQATAGAVYMYRRENDEWLSKARLTRSAPTTGGSFGGTLALLGDRLVVGSHLWNYPEMQSTQFGHIFQDRGGVWTPEAIVSARINRVPWSLGSLAFASPAFIAMAADGGDDGRTIAHLFQRGIGGAWDFAGVLQSERHRDPGTATTQLFSYGTSLFVGVWTPEPYSDVTDPDSALSEFVISGGDCNANGYGDACDLRGGVSEDCDKNGVPDECDRRVSFDADFDGDTDLHDVAGFLACYTGVGSIEAGRCCNVFDFGGDNDVDNADWNALRAALVGP